MKLLGIPAASDRGRNCHRRGYRADSCGAQKEITEFSRRPADKPPGGYDIAVIANNKLKKAAQDKVKG
jgi:hypothetical protein